MRCCQCSRPPFSFDRSAKKTSNHGHWQATDKRAAASVSWRCRSVHLPPTGPARSSSLRQTSKPARSRKSASIRSRRRKTPQRLARLMLLLHAGLFLRGTRNLIRQGSVPVLGWLACRVAAGAQRQGGSAATTQLHCAQPACRNVGSPKLPCKLELAFSLRLSRDKPPLNPRIDP